MRRVSISVLKAKLSEHLKAVKAGEEVIVTDRGRPVARLAPIRDQGSRESRVRMLVLTGQARPPDVAGGIDVDAIAAGRPGRARGPLSDAVLEERSEGP